MNRPDDSPTCVDREVNIGTRPTIGFVDPQATVSSVVGSHRRLVDMGLIRDGSLAECDVAFCEWPRYRHFRQLRAARKMSFRMNQIPKATQQIHHKKRFARHLHDRPYVPRTYLALCLRPLQGIWVEKPYNLDRAEGITFLRNPRGWWRKGHLLQRYVDDPWLVDDRKTEVRVLARIRDDGSVRVHREGLVRVAFRPFTLDDLDPLVHNSSPSFQWREGVKAVDQHLLSELVSGDKLLDAMVEIVNDTVAMLRGKRYFTGGDDFELIGYDFVVDRRGTPFLLEANRFPGLWFDDDTSERFYLGMLRALFRDV